MMFVPLFLIVWVRSPYIKLCRTYCGCLCCVSMYRLR